MKKIKEIYVDVGSKLLKLTEMLNIDNNTCGEVGDLRAIYREYDQNCRQRRFGLRSLPCDSNLVATVIFIFIIKTDKYIKPFSLRDHYHAWIFFSKCRALFLIKTHEL